MMKVVFEAHSGSDTLARVVDEAVRYARQLRGRDSGPHPSIFIRWNNHDYEIPENGAVSTVIADLSVRIAIDSYSARAVPEPDF